MKIKRCDKNIVFKAYKTKRPKFGEKACWSDSSVIINEKVVDVFWECMRGQSYYFSWEGEWYRIPFFIGKFPELETNLDDIIYKESWRII